MFSKFVIFFCFLMLLNLHYSGGTLSKSNRESKKKANKEAKVRYSQRKWRRDVRHCKLNGVITLIVSGIGTGTRIIGDNRCWPLSLFRCSVKGSI